ncbi:hypothetical protein D623_10011159 [Myotis brandtii]|uniref:Uncharacterized protein n=1 Tax=Myotis brandtii TaxID=109478 RepID=S7MBM8_MYOBR|nr:hypothetical protein D623_10011159 [Myotis brandtii]
MLCPGGLGSSLLLHQAQRRVPDKLRDTPHPPTRESLERGEDVLEEKGLEKQGDSLMKRRQSARPARWLSIDPGTRRLISLYRRYLHIAAFPAGCCGRGLDVSDWMTQEEQATYKGLFILRSPLTGSLRALRVHSLSSITNPQAVAGQSRLRTWERELPAQSPGEARVPSVSGLSTGRTPTSGAHGT